MRYHKFRGKSKIDGRWRYGYLTEISMFPEKLAIKDPISGTCIPIIPGTQGEFTSLYDKHRNEIYEGDILIYDNYDGTDYKEWHIGKHYVIKWDEEEACFECVCPGNVMSASIWKDMIVVGNVFENPELVEENN